MTKNSETVSVSLTREEWCDVQMSLLVNSRCWAELEYEPSRASHYRISVGLVNLCASIEDQKEEWDGTTAEDADECMTDDELVALFAKCLRDTYRDAKGL